MEKSVSVDGTNEKMSKVSTNNLHIHDDLAHIVLSKLPLKSLKRFGCIRKSWPLLFENSHFMNMLRTHFLSNNCSDDGGGGDMFLLLVENVPRYHAVLYLLPNENKIKLDLPPLIQEDASNPYILSSVSINGIFCLGQDIISRGRGMVNTFQAVLWNPATTEFMVIPPSPDESVPPYRDPYFHFHGFGYDHVRDDYKVIRYMSLFHVTDEDEDVPYEDRSYDPLLEIYSLRSNSWRILDVNVADFIYDSPQLGTGVYIDGVSHWWGNCRLHNSTGCLVSFDFCNDVLFTTPMLLDIDESCDFVIERRLMVLNNSIALISNCFKDTTFHIFILGKLGVMESWIKLFIVGPIPSIECPIGVGKKGDVCFKQTNDELVWIDLITQIIDEIGVKGNKYTRMGIFKESLLSFGGINS